MKQVQPLIKNIKHLFKYKEILGLGIQKEKIIIRHNGRLRDIRRLAFLVEACLGMRVTRS